MPNQYTGRKITEPRVRLFTGSRGWEELRYQEPGVIEWNDGVGIRHHRLLAIAWFGKEAVEESVVHHKNNIPWDNREDNITLMSSEDHGQISALEYWKNRD